VRIAKFHGTTAALSLLLLLCLLQKRASLVQSPVLEVAMDYGRKIVLEKGMLKLFRL
jgi:hypothetical protein